MEHVANSHKGAALGASDLARASAPFAGDTSQVSMGLIAGVLLHLQYHKCVHHLYEADDVIAKHTSQPIMSISALTLFTTGKYKKGLTNHGIQFIASVLFFTLILI